MTDFELAMRNALHFVYPTIKLHTCWFHFCQGAKRKASQLMNLVHCIKTNANIRMQTYKLLALPLLPAKEIVPCFQMVKSQVAGERVFKPFLRYFERQWIKKVISFIISLIFTIFHKEFFQLFCYRRVQTTFLCSSSQHELRVHLKRKMGFSANASWNTVTFSSLLVIFCTTNSLNRESSIF